MYSAGSTPHPALPPPWGSRRRVPVNAAEVEILDTLTGKPDIDRFWRSLYQQPGSQKRDHRPFVLEHGAFYDPVALPPEVPKMPVGYCFKNCQQLALLDGRWLYCEGYAVNPYPMMHGFLINERGQAFDPTWASCEDFHLGTAYFGVPISREYLRVHRERRNKTFAVIDDYVAGWPILDVPVEAWRVQADHFSPEVPS